MKYHLQTIAILILTTLTFSACSTNSDSGTGTLKLSLTDAPANDEEMLRDSSTSDLEKIWRNLSDEEDESEEDEEGDGWYSIMEDSITVNLLDYQNGAVFELGEAELETGQYNQIRFLLGSNNNVVIDGQTYPLTTPSGQQSGYKLNVNAEIEEDQVYELVIDFDASQSIVERGNNRFTLKPVLRTVDLEDQGNISGTVLPLEAEPFVYAIMDQDTMGTQPDEEGDFTIVGLSDGNYSVFIEPTNETYLDTLIQNIEIEDGEDFEFEDTIQLQDTVQN